MIFEINSVQTLYLILCSIRKQYFNDTEPAKKTKSMQINAIAIVRLGADLALFNDLTQYSALSV